MNVQAQFADTVRELIAQAAAETMVLEPRPAPGFARMGLAAYYADGVVVGVHDYRLVGPDGEGMYDTLVSVFLDQEGSEIVVTDDRCRPAHIAVALAVVAAVTGEPATPALARRSAVARLVRAAVGLGGDLYLLDGAEDLGPHRAARVLACDVR